MSVFDSIANKFKQFLNSTEEEFIKTLPVEVRVGLRNTVKNNLLLLGKNSQIFPFKYIIITVYAKTEEQALISTALSKKLLEEDVINLFNELKVDTNDFEVELVFTTDVKKVNQKSGFLIEFLLNTQGGEQKGFVLEVIKGKTNSKFYNLSSSCIHNIGRGELILSEQNEVLRHNNLFFIDDREQFSLSVSRMHCRIEIDKSKKVRLFNEKGFTVVRRKNDKFYLSSDDKLGFSLLPDDLIELGDARIRLVKEAITSVLPLQDVPEALQTNEGLVGDTVTDALTNNQTTLIDNKGTDKSVLFNNIW